MALLLFRWNGHKRRGETVGFGTLDGQFDICVHSVEIGLLALVMTPVILTGGIDLSVGSLLGLCAILFGKMWRDAGMPQHSPRSAPWESAALPGV
jgi:ribose/xylose/arabinose/galactoside ABC-type transport system permease subunit